MLSSAGQFTTLCKVTANTSEVTKSPTAGPNGTYYVQRFQIVLSVGRTEMQAQLAWDEKVNLVPHLRYHIRLETHDWDLLRASRDGRAHTEPRPKHY